MKSRLGNALGNKIMFFPFYFWPQMARLFSKYARYPGTVLGTWVSGSHTKISALVEIIL